MISPEKATGVGLKLGEALVYAIGKTLHESGRQGQVLLEDMGKPVLERLVGVTDPGDDPFTATKKLSRFFASMGLLDEMIVSRGDGMVTIEWRNWRILGAIRNLMSNGCHLIPCPLTITVFSLFRQHGFALQPLTELQITDDVKRNAKQAFKLVDLKTRSFEVKAERTSQAMDAELKPAQS